MSTPILSPFESTDEVAAIGTVELKTTPLVGRLLVFVSLSMLILAPCFWQDRIEAGDLASHIYNSWLTLLIEQGKAPGLWIEHQWTNILFDYALVWLSGRFGFAAAQRVAVSVSVLIFFWGAVSVVWALSRRRPWYVLACLAILTYGVIFNLGLFNYYISLGLSFFALALLWRATIWRVVAALPLLALSCLAQPLPPLWVLATIVYVWVARRATPRFQLAPFFGAIVLLLVLREVLMHRFVGVWSPKQILYTTGADQVILYGWLYRIAFLGLLAIWAEWFIRRIRVDGYRKLICDIRFQLYALCVVGALLLPKDLTIGGYNAPYGDITQRFSVIAGVLVCALINAVKPSPWRAASFLAIAVFFFSRLFVDTAAINGLETKVEHIVSELPPEQRVIGRLYYPEGGRTEISMILDRACIGRCFSYGNYEPGTLQFRVRAAPGNRIVASNQTDPLRIQYAAIRSNEPLYEIYRCGVTLTDLCIRTLD